MKVYHPWVLVFIVATTTLAQAQADTSIAGIYTKEHFIPTLEGDVNAIDSLNLTFKSGKLQFSFIAFFGYGHSCSMEGEAVKVGDHYQYQETFTDGTICRLNIISRGDDEVKLEDAGGACRTMYCGMRGQIEGTVFYRVINLQK